MNFILTTNKLRWTGHKDKDNFIPSNYVQKNTDSQFECLSVSYDHRGEYLAASKFLIWISNHFPKEPGIKFMV